MPSNKKHNAPWNAQDVSRTRRHASQGLSSRQSAKRLFDTFGEWIVAP
jgi:hypothetical protein